MDNDGFNEGERAIIEETAWRVGDKICERIKEDTRIQLRLHQSECPLSKQATFIAGGWRVAIALFGGIVAFALAALEMWKALH